MVYWVQKTGKNWRRGPQAFGQAPLRVRQCLCRSAGCDGESERRSPGRTQTFVPQYEAEHGPAATVGAKEAGNHRPDESRVLSAELSPTGIYRSRRRGAGRVTEASRQVKRSTMFSSSKSSSQTARGPAPAGLPDTRLPGKGCSFGGPAAGAA